MQFTRWTIAPPDAWHNVASMRFRNMLAVLAALALLLAAQDFAWLGSAVLPLPVDRGAAGTWQMLKRLATTASALQITAHPDDEDGGMLTYEARGQGVRMGLLTLTRGEGGQNIINDDYFDAAGILRTREVLDADRFYGVSTQMFTRAVDYGYSRSVAEARRKWGEQRVLGDVVRAIRTFRPLVILSRFQGAPRDGHAHHQMAGLLARAAFRAAADPTQFPEQLRQGLRPWQARKLYMDNVRANEAWNVDVSAGGYDPVLGETYEEISRQGWWQHISQYGGGAIAHPGPDHSYYKRLAPDGSGADHEASFFAGLDTSLPGLAAWAGAQPPVWLAPSLQQIARQVSTATAVFRMTAPQDSVPALARGLALTRSLANRLAAAAAVPAAARADIGAELALKERQFQAAIADALGAQVLPMVAPEQQAGGFFARFRWNDTLRVAVPGETFPVAVDVSSRSPLPVRVASVRLAAHWRPGGTTSIAASQPLGNAGALAGAAVSTWNFQVLVPPNADYTRPYWRPRDSVEESWYQLDEPQYILRPFAPYPLQAVVTLSVDGVPVEIRRNVLTTRHETGLGQVLLPLIVGPAISVALTPQAAVLPIGNQGAAPFAVTAQISGDVAAAARGTVRLHLPAGWKSDPAAASFDLPRAGAEATVRFTVTPGAIAAGTYTIAALANYDGQTYREGFRMVGYRGLRPYPLYGPASARAIGVPVRVTPGVKLGYVMGTGDTVPQALATLGVNVTLLGPQDLAAGNLDQYDEIMLGVRAYAARSDVRRFNQRLLQYVHQGGVLVVQYNTGEMNHDYGPYPYDMSRGTRVTQEEEPVRILDPGSPLFTFPNRITTADFDDWVEERGHGFWDSWAPEYHPLLETHDQEQAAQKGGLLIARYGRGLYVYDAFALYRQLPQGVPGAFRLLANLVSLPKAPRGD